MHLDHALPSLGLAALLALITLPAAGQLPQSTTPEVTGPEMKEKRPPAPPELVETFHLKNVGSTNDLIDMQSGLRNTYPRLHTFILGPRNAITVSGTAEELEGARKLLAELDQQLPVYKLTYTLTELGDGKPPAPQRYTQLVTGQNRSVLKSGLRVPVVTGATTSDDRPPSTFVQYVDAGLTLDSRVEGNHLSFKVELSSVAEEKSGLGGQDPILNQRVLESSTRITAGKSVLLGSIDEPGNRRLQVELSIEVQ